MRSISSALKTARTLQEIRVIADKTNAKLSFWGKHSVTMTGSSGSLTVNALANRLKEISLTINEWDADKRDTIRFIGRQINRLNKESLDNALNCHWVTRILLILRMCFYKKEEPMTTVIDEFQESIDLYGRIHEAIDRDFPIETILRLLRDNRLCLSAEHRGMAAIHAALHRNLPALELLFADGPILYKDQGQILVAAVKSQHFPMILFLTSNVRLIILPNHIWQATLEATKGENTGILRHLSRIYPLNAYIRGLAVIEAAQRNSIEKVNFLLDGNEDIPEENRSEALIIAAERGSFENVNALLQGNAFITSDHRAKAVLATVHNNHLPILLRILESGPISDEKRGEAVIEAVNGERNEQLRVLLANGPITIERRGQAAVLAQEHGRDDLLQMLRDHGPISLPHREQIEKLMLGRQIHRRRLEEAGIAL